jgi:hypothetical protein
MDEVSFWKATVEVPLWMTTLILLYLVIESLRIIVGALLWTVRRFTRTW